MVACKAARTTQARQITVLQIEADNVAQQCAVLKIESQTSKPQIIARRNGRSIGPSLKLHLVCSRSNALLDERGLLCSSGRISCRRDESCCGLLLHSAVVLFSWKNGGCQRRQGWWI